MVSVCTWQLSHTKKSYLRELHNRFWQNRHVMHIQNLHIHRVTHQTSSDITSYGSMLSIYPSIYGKAQGSARAQAVFRTPVGDPCFFTTGPGLMLRVISRNFVRGVHFYTNLRQHSQQESCRGQSIPSYPPLQCHTVSRHTPTNCRPIVVIRANLEETTEGSLAR